MLNATSIRKTMMPAYDWCYCDLPDTDFFNKTPYNHTTEIGLGETNQQKEIWPYETFLRFRIDKSTTRGDDIHTSDIVYPGEPVSTKLMSAAINYINDEIWYTKVPDDLTLIRYSKTLEMARMAADIVQANILEKCGAKTKTWSELEKKALIATHMLMEFNDEWLNEKIHWKPFANFHNTDDDLKRNLSAPFTNRQIKTLKQTRTKKRPIAWSRFADKNTGKAAIS